MDAARTRRSTAWREQFEDNSPRGVSPLGDLVRIERTRQGLSQKELADMANLAQTTISMIEIGANNPFPDTRLKVANALGIPVVDLYVAAGEIPGNG
jgi:transcriptional regulator with XRE-family HTH domain